MGLARVVLIATTRGCSCWLVLLIILLPFKRVVDDLLYHGEGCTDQAAPIVVAAQGVVRCPELARARYTGSTPVYGTAQLTPMAVGLATILRAGILLHILLR